MSRFVLHRVSRGVDTSRLKHTVCVFNVFVYVCVQSEKRTVGWRASDIGHARSEVAESGSETLGGRKGHLRETFLWQNFLEVCVAEARGLSTTVVRFVFLLSPRTLPHTTFFIDGRLKLPFEASCLRKVQFTERTLIFEKRTAHGQGESCTGNIKVERHVIRVPGRKKNISAHLLESDMRVLMTYLYTADWLFNNA